MLLFLHQVYDQMKARFTVDDYSHYIFTPRDLTKWVMGLLRSGMQYIFFSIYFGRFDSMALYQKKPYHGRHQTIFILGTF